MEGYVEEVKHGRWGFGNHLYVNHGNGIRSLYAHLAKIEVKTNDFVKKGMIIGLVGSTGWSSGPHLHFQVWEEEKLVNPKFFFEGYFGQKLASAR
jgi:murein DD-endopeptidase MepM/ murein hydrolase activator NlpD